MKKALITGINGQDGSYLAEFLLEKGYEVWGTVKRNSVSETQSSRIESLRDGNLINLEYADLTDMASLIRILSKVQPDEVYNLAAQSHVRISFDQPIYTANVTGVGTLNLLEAIRMVSPHSKIYQQLSPPEEKPNSSAAVEAQYSTAAKALHSSTAAAPYSRDV